MRARADTIAGADDLLERTEQFKILARDADRGIEVGDLVQRLDNPLGDAEQGRLELTPRGPVRLFL